MIMAASFPPYLLLPFCFVFEREMLLAFGEEGIIAVGWPVAAKEAEAETRDQIDPAYRGQIGGNGESDPPMRG